MLKYRGAPDPVVTTKLACKCQLPAPLATRRRARLRRSRVVTECHIMVFFGMFDTGRFCDGELEPTQNMAVN